MKSFLLLHSIIFLVLVSGCSTMNSDFTCKVTAEDSCLTIEQVDHMTRFADRAHSSYKPRSASQKSRIKKRQAYLNQQNLEPVIWIAPWKDKKGTLHPSVKHYAGRTPHVKKDKELL